MTELKIISEGKDNGDGVIMSGRTRRGTDIYCLGVPLFYSMGGDWDLGPTWCYVIAGKKVTLVDTGQFGKFDVLKAMLEKAGFSLKDIERVIITHGHEDHDGNIPEVIEATGAKLWAHFAYENMVAYYPGINDGAARPDFPGSCRCCLMPDKFNASCRSYHQKRSHLKVDQVVGGDGTVSFTGDFRFMSTPGHSPDAICTILEDEVVFTGDTVLATITPHPSLMLEYLVNRRILPSQYAIDNTSYGLMVYIRSLNEIKNSCKEVDLLLPGHRLYEKGRINLLKPVERAEEIIRFHKERCANILGIMREKVMGLEEISIELFPSRLRAGFGRFLSQREVMSHLELMAECGDITWVDKNNFASRTTGSKNYTDFFSKFI